MVHYYTVSGKPQPIYGLACTGVSFLITRFYLAVLYPDILKWQWHQRRVILSHGWKNCSCFSITKGPWELWGLWGCRTTIDSLPPTSMGEHSSPNGGRFKGKLKLPESHSLNLSLLKSFSEVHISKLGFSISVFSLFYICASSTRWLGIPPHLLPFNLFLFCRALEVVWGACEDNSINLSLPW